MAVLAGAIDLPAYATERRQNLACDWLPTKWDWIDPAKDAAAQIRQIEAGLKSRTQAIAERGYDAEQVDREIAAERKREAGAGIKSAWRGQISGAELGTRLGNSIRPATCPKGGESLDAAALVGSTAPVIVGAHDTGPPIRSRQGFWLAIPATAAGKSTRGGRITPGEWERRTGLACVASTAAGVQACWWPGGG